MSEALKKIIKGFDEWSKKSGFGLVLFLDKNNRLDGYYYNKKTGKRK